MKKILYILVLFAFSGLALSSCEDFLDKQPSDKGNAEGAVTTPNDAWVSLRGIMRSMTTSNIYGCNLIMYGDAKGGDLAVPSMGMGLDGLYTFNHYANTGSYSGFWSSGYFILLQINSLLQNIERLEAEGATGFNTYKGQALTLRALLYFDLVRLYGRPYNYDKASYGVPLILEPLSADAQPTRASVEDVYTQILKDLSDGRALLESNRGAKADDKVGGAWTAAEEIIASEVYTLYTVGNWVSSWSIQNGSESIFELAMVPGEGALSYPLGYYLMRDEQVTNANGNFVASDAFINRLNEDITDVRKGVMDYDATDPTEARMGSCYKYSGGVNLAGDGKTPFSAVNIKLFRLSEIYLIAAEAALLKSSPDKQLAASRLNEIRKRAPALAPATQATITEDMILDERSKELFAEGHRFFDMMRKNRSITFQDGFYHGTISTHRPTTIDRTFFRTILPISQDEINANPALAGQQNPGY